MNIGLDQTKAKDLKPQIQLRVRAIGKYRTLLMISNRRVNIGLIDQRQPIITLNSGLIYCISSLLFIIYPLLGCLSCVLLTFISNDKKGVSYSFFLLWLFIVLLQSTRVLKPIIDDFGDWGRYGDFYREASTTAIFLTEQGRKDIAFTLWNFLGNGVFGVDYLAFADFTVDIEMLFFGLSAYRIWKYSNANARVGLTALILVFFFSEIILISNNLLRQMFATSIIVYGLILRYTNSRFWPLFLVWGFLTHSMTLVFVPLFFIRINYKIPSRIILLSLTWIIGFVLFFSIAKGFFMSSSLYILQRIGGADSYLKDDVINPIVVYKFAFVVSLIFGRSYFTGEHNKYIWFGYNTLMYVTIICILTATMPLLVTRIYIDRLPLLSFVIPYVFYRKSVFSDLYQLSVILFFVIRFVFFSQGEYLNLSKISLLPFISFI